MYGFFDKHGKKLLAVLAALLAMVFLLPAGFEGLAGGGGGGQLGKIDGRRVAIHDVQQAQSLIRSLDRLLVPAQGPDGQSTLAPAPIAVFGPDLYRRLESDPVLLYLLMHEAQQVGAVGDAATIERLFSAPSRFRTDATKDIEIERVNPTVKDELRDQMARLISVAQSFNRARLAAKVTRPMVNEELARIAQQIKIRVAAFDAADYEKVVPAPTAEELQRQFASYKDLAPAVTDANPFGFGYRVPDRVSVQWLAVTTADATKAVEAGRTPEKWEEDAYFYYSKNAAQFAATQPAGTTVPAARPYEQVKADVMKKLRDPLIAQKKREVASRIAQRLNAVAPASQPTTGPTMLSSEPAFTAESLNALADTIQKQTGVRPVVSTPTQLFSQAELNKQPGFGGAVLNDPAFGFLSAADYVFTAFKPLRASDASNLPASLGLDVGRATAVLNGIDGLYVGRVVGYAKSQPAESLESVKPQVEKDARRTRAYAMAADAAQALLDKAKTAGGLDKAGAAAVQTSDWVSAFDTAPAGLSADWARGLVAPAFETLRGVPSATALPVYTVSKLRQDGKAVVVEVFAIQTRLNTEIEPLARRQAEQMATQDLMSREFVQDWFTLDAVARRVGYVPDAAPQEPTPVNTNRRVNPLMPG